MSGFAIMVAVLAITLGGLARWDRWIERAMEWLVGTFHPCESCRSSAVRCTGDVSRGDVK